MLINPYTIFVMRFKEINFKVLPIGFYLVLDYQFFFSKAENIHFITT